MKKRKKALVYSTACALLIIYIARVYCVNAQTHLTREYYDIGDQVRVGGDGYTVSIEDMKTYDVEAFFHTYPELKDEYYIDIAMPSARTKYIAVCTVTAVCNIVGAQDYEFVSNYINVDNKFTGADLFLSLSLSGRDLIYYEKEQEPDKAVSVKLVYIINTFDLSKKSIEDLEDLELYVLVGYYPVEKNISVGTVSEHLVEAEE